MSLSDGVTTTEIGTYTSALGAFVVRASAPVLIPDGSTYTLRYCGLSATDRTSFIDNIALAVAPEASTWAMLLAGFGMIGFATRCRVMAAT